MSLHPHDLGFLYLGDNASSPCFVHMNIIKHPKVVVKRRPKLFMISLNLPDTSAAARGLRIPVSASDLFRFKFEPGN
jgi:hypothetical protein